ncbi:hypothetical protein [Nitrosovibrio sp. Nv17]|uniref:hypothetical protein n=1 Tax=Nitrosovibrio sp. Nv17 TaxID=1855339 RepID=UPI000908B726|nr:hypothetical protein [Nitrosovibrio sp. Nv17]SFW11666.1 hypothetical protein SAMN05216414_101292 [Nitrosovibrio sp. Nv17]
MSERFIGIVNQAFSFLNDAGFCFTKNKAGQSQYETDKCIVIIKRDIRSGGLEVFVGPRLEINQTQNLYSLTDILDMQGVLPRNRRMSFQIADEKRLRPFVDQLAREVEAHAQPALAGDRMFFRRLKTFRHSKADALMQGMKVQRVRSEVEEAWQKRDFKRIVDLYISIENHLTKSERLKLEYAKEHWADY